MRIIERFLVFSFVLVSNVPFLSVRSNGSLFSNAQEEGIPSLINEEGMRGGLLSVTVVLDRNAFIDEATSIQLVEGIGDDATILWDVVPLGISLVNLTGDDGDNNDDLLMLAPFSGGPILQPYFPEEGRQGGPVYELIISGFGVSGNTSTTNNQSAAAIDTGSTTPASVLWVYIDGLLAVTASNGMFAQEQPSLVIPLMVSMDINRESSTATVVSVGRPPIVPGIVGLDPRVDNAWENSSIPFAFNISASSDSTDNNTTSSSSPFLIVHRLNVLEEEEEEEDDGPPFLMIKVTGGELEMVMPSDSGYYSIMLQKGGLYEIMISGMEIFDTLNSALILVTDQEETEGRLTRKLLVFAGTRDDFIANVDTANPPDDVITIDFQTHENASSFQWALVTEDLHVLGFGPLLSLSAGGAKTGYLDNARYIDFLQRPPGIGYVPLYLLRTSGDDSLIDIKIWDGLRTFNGANNNNADLRQLLSSRTSDWEIVSFTLEGVPTMSPAPSASPKPSAVPTPMPTPSPTMFSILLTPFPSAPPSSADCLTAMNNLIVLTLIMLPSMSCSITLLVW